MIDRCLADRLSWLEQAGVVARRRDSNNAGRVAYSLPEKRIDLNLLLLGLIRLRDRRTLQLDAAAPEADRVADPQG